MVVDVAENLASVGAQEVRVGVTRQEDVDDRKNEITDEDIQQESQSDLSVESLSKAANCEVEDDGDEGEDGRYQEGGWVEDTRQKSLVLYHWRLLIQALEAPEAHLWPQWEDRARCKLVFLLCQYFSTGTAGVDVGPVCCEYEREEGDEK